MPEADARPEPVATIGYEGVSVREFLDTLKDAGTELLVDVRALAASRRPGFAKTALSANLEDAGIRYLHFRKLGTPAEGRAAARAGNYDRLREIYLEQLATPEAQGELAQLAELVRQGQRICLMCFEADPAHCHRRYVADALQSLVPVEVRHLHVATDD